MAIDGSFNDYRYNPSCIEELTECKRTCDNLKRLNDRLEEQAKYYIREIFELRAELNYAKMIGREL